MKLRWNFVLLLLMCFGVQQMDAGPGAVALCYGGCAAVQVACYAAAGSTFGTVTVGVGTPAVILACNAAFAKCMATCSAAFLLPTP